MSSKELAISDPIGGALGVSDGTINPEDYFDQKEISPIPKDDIELMEAKSEHKRTDYTDARDNIRDAISKSSAVLLQAAAAAAANPIPRQIEVFTQLAKAFTEMNMDLIEVSDTGHTQAELPNNTTNNTVVFQGESDNVVDLIRKQMNK